MRNKRDSVPLIAMLGMVFLAVMCCVGIPLIASAVATVEAGALFGGLGVAIVVTLIAVVVVLAHYLLRHRGGMPDGHTRSG